MAVGTEVICSVAYYDLIYLFCWLLLTQSCGYYCT